MVVISDIFNDLMKNIDIYVIESVDKLVKMTFESDKSFVLEYIDVDGTKHIWSGNWMTNFDNIELYYHYKLGRYGSLIPYNKYLRTKIEFYDSGIFFFDNICPISNIKYFQNRSK